tara:strand:+ start:405 stop:641 length:237 start_codon:yes stop_codon:yes gene_type:complete
MQVSDFVVSEGTHWGMVWKINRIKKENELLYQLLDEVLQHKGYYPKKTLKENIKYCRETLEREEHIKLQKKLAKLKKY